MQQKKLKKRFKQARKHPEKGWRVDEQEWRIYDLYDEALPVVERLIRKTSSGNAPWH